MSDFEILEIDIHSLFLNLENPRFDKLENQKEVYKAMIENQGEKIINLAHDIAISGINPSDLTMVTHFKNDKKKYIVLEGNRRVAAIKFLLEPSLASNGGKKRYDKKFNDLSKKINKKTLEKMRCVVFKDREKADHWISIKHTGENEGVGIVQWGAKEKARFNARYGKSSQALQIIDFLKEYGELDVESKEKIDNISITNLDRLIGDPTIRDAIGLSITNNLITTKLPKIEILKSLKKIANDLIDKSIKVNNIYHKKDRREYIENFNKENFPNKKLANLEPWSLIEYSKELEKKHFAATKRLKKTKSYPLKRKTIIPTDCKLKIKNMRLNKIYRELKSLDVDEYTNSGAILVRVFLELSLDNFITIKSLPNLDENTSLPKKLKGVSDHFINNNILTKSQLKPINIAISNKNNIFSIDTLHAYVHNINLIPNPSDLKTTWDNIQLFVEKIWE